MAKTDLTAQRVREVFDFNRETGAFTWRVHVQPVLVGRSTFGAINSTGYQMLRIDRKRYLAHRVAWMHAYGEWPDGDIDHINGIRADNRLSNLRKVDRSQNSQNQRKAGAANTSGYLGVSPTASGTWRAKIVVGGKFVNIGTFADPHVAHLAYLDAKRRFHENCTI